MAFNQKEYTKEYQKKNYKMFVFRVRKDDKEVINKLKKAKNRNEYIINLIKNTDQIKQNNVLTLKEIKLIIKPILNKKGINEIYLFGSYARGEANTNSDIDIYCEHGNVKSLYDVYDINEELKKALKKDVDVVFKGSKMEKTFEENMKRDLIKIC